jgi:SAM-dependent methyltransferase
MPKEDRHPAPGSIRPLYDAYGADGYYKAFGNSYANPHEPEIRALLENNRQRIDYRRVLDLGAGGGEVTRTLAGMGFHDSTGCDPYTFELFEHRTGRPCWQLGFADIVRRGLPESGFTAVICSFSLHLCPANELFPLCWNLLQHAPVLVVVTPHKRPELEKFGGIDLFWEDAVCTHRGKKVRMKAYGLGIQ